MVIPTYPWVGIAWYDHKGGFQDQQRLSGCTSCSWLFHWTYGCLFLVTYGDGCGMLWSCGFVSPSDIYCKIRMRCSRVGGHLFDGIGVHDGLWWIRYWIYYAASWRNEDQFEINCVILIYSLIDCVGVIVIIRNAIVSVHGNQVLVHKSSS